MNKLKSSIPLLLILCSSITCFGQEKPKLLLDIERVFREKEARWKVERINYQKEFDPNKEDIVFRSGKVQAAVSIKIWEKIKDAQDVFEATSIAFSNTHAKMIKSRLPGLGDEGYIWKSRGSDAWPTIYFRKGNVNVTVFAPSVAVAKRFAQHIAEQIPPSNNSFDASGNRGALSAP
jgi:hypothetical protein